MTEQHMNLDWDGIQNIAKCDFPESVRDEIENNLQWYKLRSGDYADEVSAKDFAAALVALGNLAKTETSRSRLEPIEDELATVQWFLDVMSNAQDEATVSAKYFLYCRIWQCVGKAGMKLSQGKGTDDHRLSVAQKVFREILRQYGIEFTSDQAVASALKRALKESGIRGQK